jgi:hypothetical protein
MFAKAAVRGHRGQAIDAGAAQGTQQEGLGLVVLVLRQCQRFAVAQFGRERGTSCLPRCAFKAQACAVVDLHAMHGQFDAQCAHCCWQCSTQSSASGCRPWCTCTARSAVPEACAQRHSQCSSTVESTPPL